MTDGEQTSNEALGPVSVSDLERFCREVLAAAGADDATVDAAARAMMHGTRLGIDSHGVRLLDHYVTAMTGGRVNPRPHLELVQESGAVATLNADNGHGACATYYGMEQAIRLAGQSGIGAVAIRNSSHFGPAGAYALAAAEAGLIGVATCNSDSLVRLHDGATPFHGTNPIACAVPSGGSQSWLLDMATSAIPGNRVELYKSLGQELPEHTASDAEGQDTRDPEAMSMLAPLGGSQGFKGAGLAGLAEILSAVLTGMRLSFDIAPMGGPDFSTPRGLGAFVLALKPDAFVDKATFEAGMTRYLEVLRSSAPRSGASVMAPGDREWAEAERRMRDGVPLDPATSSAFARLSETYSIAMPRSAAAGR